MEMNDFLNMVANIGFSVAFTAYALNKIRKTNVFFNNFLQ